MGPAITPSIEATITSGLAVRHPRLLTLEGLDIPPTGKAERGGILVTKTLVFAGEGSGLFAAPRETGGPAVE